MNLQSKFGYCMTTQTLNIALFVNGTELRTDRQTNMNADFAKAEIFYRTFGLVKSNISPDRIKICRTEKFKWNFDK